MKTPQERGAIICSLLNFKPVSRQDADNFDAVVKEITEAEREAEQKGLRSNLEICPTCRYFTPRKTDGHLCRHLQTAHADGFHAAVEKAAKEAETHKVCEEGKCWYDIAESIRALKGKP